MAPEHRAAIHAVTGAFGYSGRAIAAKLLEQGIRVRSLTGHPNRPDPFGGRVEVVPLPFDDPAALRKALDGVEVLYNTYWVRFDHGASTFERAVANSRQLFRIAAEAGVARVVHVSITNPSGDSPLPYFRGKAQVEQALRDSPLSYAILRPAVFFGGQDVLLNNIAWLLRRLPVFGMARGAYGLQPIHVDDFARLAIAQGASCERLTMDAVGPEAPSFTELVGWIKAAVGSNSLVTSLPWWALRLASRVFGLFLGDVPLTRDEIAGLTANLLVSGEAPTGVTSLRAWLREHGSELGRTWANELARHYRPACRASSLEGVGTA